MLTPEQVDALAEGLVSGHQETMIRRLMEQLVAALAKDGELSVKDLALLDRVADQQRDAVNLLLVEMNPRIQAQTRAAVLAALQSADEADAEILSTLYPGVAVAGASAGFNRIAVETATGLAQIIARDNLMMAVRAQQVWYDVTAEAITRYNHGAETADRIIADAVRRLSREGFTTIDYKSGVRSQIDVAVRRHIVTQVGQAAGRMTEARCDEYGHELVQTSAHFGARPDHAVWQGRAFRRGGAGVVDGVSYPGFEESTGYGTGSGLLGWNCKHTFGMYFPGLSTLPELPERDERGRTGDELYEATQKQRGYERAIRETKREIAGLEAAGVEPTSDAMVAARLQLGVRQKRLKQWVDSQGLSRLPKREKAYGIGGGLSVPRALRKPSPKSVLPRQHKLPDVPHARVAGSTILAPGRSRYVIRPGDDILEVLEFAGPHVRRAVDKAEHLVANYGGSADAWAHAKGYTHLVSSARSGLAEVHWFEEPGIGIVELTFHGWRE